MLQIDRHQNLFAGRRIGRQEQIARMRLPVDHPMTVKAADQHPGAANQCPSRRNIHIRGGVGPYAEHFVGGSVSNREYVNTYHAAYMGLRHRLKMNYLNKDGSVHTTRRGSTGSGADIIWHLYALDYPNSTSARGRYWKDGVLYPGY